MNNFYQVSGKVWKYAAAPLLFLLFFLLSAENASAQSYVDGPTAVTRLKNESTTLYNLLLVEIPGTPTYNQLAARIHYYNTIVAEITGANKSVAVAIEDAVTGLCYPSDSADCNPLDKTLAIPVVNDTKAKLRN